MRLRMKNDNEIKKGKEKVESVFSQDFSYNIHDFANNSNAWIEIPDFKSHPKDLIIAKDIDGNIIGDSKQVKYDFKKIGKGTGTLFGVSIYGFKEKKPVNLFYVSYKLNKIIPIGTVTYQPNNIFGTPIKPLLRSFVEERN